MTPRPSSRSSSNSVWVDSASCPSRQLITWPHEAEVYRVNGEYAQVYENRTQDSRDLNEPPSNIRNGLGVFSAFNSLSVSFEVARTAQ